MRKFLRPSFDRPSFDRTAWQYQHLSGMLGSYIATVSAFSAVNFSFLPVVVRWLWPSVVGVPLIFYSVWYYRRQGAR